MCGATFASYIRVSGPFWADVGPTRRTMGPTSSHKMTQTCTKQRAPRPFWAQNGPNGPKTSEHGQNLHWANVLDNSFPHVGPGADWRIFGLCRRRRAPSETIVLSFATRPGKKTLPYVAPCAHSRVRPDKALSEAICWQFGGPSGKTRFLLWPFSLFGTCSGPLGTASSQAIVQGFGPLLWQRPCPCAPPCWRISALEGRAPQPTHVQPYMIIIQQIDEIGERGPNRYKATPQTKTRR